MATVKNYGLKGVASQVQFGKGGGQLNYGSGVFNAFAPNGSDFANVRVNLTPTDAHDATSKEYVDNLLQGLDVKASVRVLTTTAPGTYAGDAYSSVSGTIDGVTLNNGDRVLVNIAGGDAGNGIWVYNSSASSLARAEDANDISQNGVSGTHAEVTAGMFTFVEEGSSSDCGFVLTTTGAITLGTTPLSFTQFSSAGVLKEGLGIEFIVSGTNKTVNARINTTQMTRTSGSGSNEVAIQGGAANQVLVSPSGSAPAAWNWITDLRSSTDGSKTLEVINSTNSEHLVLSTATASGSVGVVQISTTNNAQLKISSGTGALTIVDGSTTINSTGPTSITDTGTTISSSGATTISNTSTSISSSGTTSIKDTGTVISSTGNTTISNTGTSISSSGNTTIRDTGTTISSSGATTINNTNTQVTSSGSMGFTSQGGDITLNSGNNEVVVVGHSFDVTVVGGVSIKGADINMNTTGVLTIRDGGTDISSTGTTSIKDTGTTISSTGATNITNTATNITSSGAVTIKDTATTISSTGNTTIYDTGTTVSSSGATNITNTGTNVTSSGAVTIKDTSTSISSSGTTTIVDTGTTVSSSGNTTINNTGTAISSSGAVTIKDTSTTISSTGNTTIYDTGTTVSSSGATNITNTATNVTSGAVVVNDTSTTISSTGATTIYDAGTTISSTGATVINNTATTISSSGTTNITANNGINLNSGTNEVVITGESFEVSVTGGSSIQATNLLVSVSGAVTINDTATTISSTGATTINDAGTTISSSGNTTITNTGTTVNSGTGTTVINNGGTTINSGTGTVNVIGSAGIALNPGTGFVTTTTTDYTGAPSNALTTINYVNTLVSEHADHIWASDKKTGVFTQQVVDTGVTYGGANSITTYVEDSSGNMNKVVSIVTDPSAVTNKEFMTLANKSGEVRMEAHDASGTNNVDIRLVPQGSGQVFIGDVGDGVIQADDGHSLTVLGGDTNSTSSDAGPLNLAGGNGAGTHNSGNVTIKGGHGGAANGTVVIQTPTGEKTMEFLAPTGTAVNYFTATGAAHAGSPTIAAVGADTNVDLTLAPKGSGVILAPAGYNALLASAPGNALIDKDFVSGSLSAGVTGGIFTLLANFDETNVSGNAVTVGTLKANTRAMRVRVIINTSFNSGEDCTVDVAGVGSIVVAADNDLSDSAGTIYELVVNTPVSSDSAVTLTVVGSGTGAGTGTVIVEYIHA